VATEHKPASIGVNVINQNIPTEDFIFTNKDLFFDTKKSYMQSRRTVADKLREDPQYFTKYYKLSTDITETTR
jgi:hypothetical protein